MGENVSVIIVSDHGFKDSTKYYYYFFNLNSILLTFKEQISNIDIKEKIYSISDVSHVASAKKNIRILGILNKEEYEYLKESLKEYLSKIKIIETGNQIFKILHDTDYGFIVEVDMKSIEKNPLYHIIINDKKYPLENLIKKMPFSGEHDYLGIIILSGKNFSKNKKIQNATIYDITPTILYLMDLPVAKDMKGKVLTDAIEEKYLKRHPIKYIKTYEKEKIKKIPIPVRSIKDREKIEEGLRSLGYIQ